MHGIRFVDPRGLATLAVVGLAAVLAVAPWGSGPTALADPFSVSFDLGLDDTSGTSQDNGGTPGVVEPDDNPDVVNTVSLDTTPSSIDEAFFDLTNTLFSGLAPAFGVAIADGAWTGTVSFSVESNLGGWAALSNVASDTGQPPVCGTGATLGTEPGPPVRLYDADLGTGTDDDKGLGPGIVSEQDTDDDGLRQTEEDNFGADGTGPPNGLYDGIDLLPDALANYFVPSIGFASPIARSFGVATIQEALGVTIDVNLLLFNLGEGEYLIVTILGYPGVPPQEPSRWNLLNQTVVTCPPFTSTVTLFGVTQDNSSACCAGSPNPNITGGDAQRTAAADGTYSYELLVSSGDNYDGDAAAAPYDSCPDTVSIDTDLPPAGSPDPDGDRWDSACDVGNMPSSDGAAEVGGACTNAVSDDGDTLINEGCPTVGSSPERGAQCLNAIDDDPGDDGISAVNDGCGNPSGADNDGDTLVGDEGGQYNVPLTGQFPLHAYNCNQSYITSGGGWACDQDVDGDTTLNTVDNCPTTPDIDLDNADEDGNPLTGIDWQLDSDGDTVGDICDPSPLIKGDGSGYDIGGHPHGLDFPGEPTGYWDHDRICNDEFIIPAEEGTLDAVCVDTVDSGNDGDPDFLDRDGDTAYDIGEPIDADGDADGDGHSDACEAVSGSDPLDASSILPASVPPGDCDADGASDDDEEVVGTDFRVPDWQPPPPCIDRDGDSTCRDPDNDPDDDGCTDAQEAALGSVFDPNAWYDVYDVPAPVAPDPDLNGPRSRKVDMQDIMAVLFYFGIKVGGGPTVNAVDYESTKGIDTANHPNLMVGHMYDRSQGLDPDPVTGKDPAGPPSGKVDMIDVMAVLGAYGINCQQ